MFENRYAQMALNVGFGWRSASKLAIDNYGYIKTVDFWKMEEEGYFYKKEERKIIN